MADTLRQFGAAYLVERVLSTVQAEAWRDIVACRTALLRGGGLTATNVVTATRNSARAATAAAPSAARMPKRLGCKGD